MTTVILTEKASVAADIAGVLGVKARSKFHIEAKDGTFITWARGHLLELVEPQVYDEAWGGFWKWEQLPMIPPAWKYHVIRGCGDQVKAIGALLKSATRVILATDAGREGELIGRLILEFCRYKGRIDRFWASEMTPAGIKKALGALRPGAEFEPLLEAAKARQRSDWMYGLTGTRAATLAARIRGEAFPMGRVQTPTLALVVHHDERIANFKSATYYELEASVTTASGKNFKMWHAPAEEARITDKKAAEALLAKAQRASAPLRVEKEPGSERPPLPFSLPTLQREANRVLGFSANTTLKLAQALYELKVTTYPRTDCEHLAENQKAEVSGVLAAVASTFPGKVAELQRQGVQLRPSLFDDSKLSDHHAIIPTYLTKPLKAEEAQLYALICQRYLQALAGDMRYDQTKVWMDANGVEFKATDRVINDPGWQAIAAA
ncbi:DNA topoisomerase 3 [compost metagenome]